jgi:GGDEF domain-containing protein
MTDDFIDLHTGERLARAARAAQTLSETLWEALNEEFGAAPRRDHVAGLSERLADVSLVIASLARAGAPVASEPDASVTAAPSMATPPVAISDRGAESARERPLGGERPWGGPGLGERDAQSEVPRARERPYSGSLTAPSRPASSATAPSAPPPPTSGGAVLIDERAQSPGEQPAPAQAPSGIDAQEPPEIDVRVSPPSNAQAPSEIEIRDERREHAKRDAVVPDERTQSQWIAAIERRLERHERDRQPFAVLLIELVDIERLRHAELPGEVARMMGSVETALSGELRPADSLMRESPGRYWLLAPETDSTVARALAERLARAVRVTNSHRGAPLEVAVGIAICPLDGNQAAALAARADIALYAARAAGRPSAP